ncbi:MAG TPA: lipoprotein-releasing ABC transporter permease subunit [Thermopetrobacter sp.]|nr:lipoprotein-releasing ABC transporter permease subunit [Thermopetrobacter sp.]
MSGTMKDTAPFSAWERMLAGRYLRARRAESVVSVIAGFSFLGIMLGVATLIIVMAVMNGFRNELMDKILGFSGHVTVHAGNLQPIRGYDELAARLRKVEGVVSAMPFVEGQVMASSSRAVSGVKVRGLSEADLKRLRGVNNGKLKGALDGLEQNEAIAAGYRLVWRHGLALGDKLTLISPDGDETPFGITPRIRSFPVQAVFEAGMSLVDSSVVYMPLKAAQEYFNTDDGVTGIEVMVTDPQRVEEVAARLKAALGPGYQLITWKRANATFFSALEVERTVMFVILALIILVAALNIISGLIMLVKDKSGDIAILRTMGASRGAVLRIFFMTGAAIGVAGTLAGVILGVVVALNVEQIKEFVSWLTGRELFPAQLYYLSKLPSDLDAGQVLFVAAFALSLSFIATLYPAWRAARLDPVEALRYE